jgi:ribonucleotide reductase beta subunit family protein with ferritin-like domain
LLKTENPAASLRPLSRSKTLEYAAWALYKKAASLHHFGTVEELDLSVDRSHYPEISPDEHHFLSHVLAFFATAHGIVNETLLLKFASALQPPETRWFYGLQIAIENIHAKTYSLLIATLISDLGSC